MASLGALEQATCKLTPLEAMHTIRFMLERGIYVGVGPILWLSDYVYSRHERAGAVLEQPKE